MTAPRLTWDCGTCYDLFISLHVLHEPSTFGLRPSWAAGVRSRLPGGARQTLEEAQETLRFPLGWLQTLPEPKDSAAALWALGQIPPQQRLPTLGRGSEIPAEALEIFQAVARRGTWSSTEVESLREAYRLHKTPPRSKVLEQMLTTWSQPEDFGERYLAALQAYRDAFFAEEEERIRPALEAAVAATRQLAETLAFEDLIEQISRGVRFEGGLEDPALLLVPSYWITPLVVHVTTEDHGVFLFGGRPEDVSLVPGEQVPDGMLRTLKTLADPTRLRILRYLSEETMSPAQLARRLRLRAPTVTHHLNLLRLSGLVYLTLADENRKFYATRPEAIGAMLSTLEDFLQLSAEEISRENHDS